MMALFLGGPRHGLTSEVNDNAAVIYVDVETPQRVWNWTDSPFDSPISLQRVIYMRQVLRVFGTEIMVWCPADSVPSSAELAEVLLSPLARQCIVG